MPMVTKMARMPATNLPKKMMPSSRITTVFPFSAIGAEDATAPAVGEGSLAGCGWRSEDWQYRHLMASSRISSLQNGQTFMLANLGHEVALRLRRIRIKFSTSPRRRGEHPNAHRGRSRAEARDTGAGSARERGRCMGLTIGMWKTQAVELVSS